MTVNYLLLNYLSPCEAMKLCYYLIFRMMYWDSVSRLVAPGGILVSILKFASS